MNRYHRQALLPQVGPAGQARLAASRVAIVGCGALGTVAAELLARAGIGFLRVVDRDLVELTNLQRQTLFDEADVRDALPKAVAAVGRLKEINSSIAIEPVVADVHAGNIESLVGDGVDLIIDGTDNAETRYLINDVAIKHNRPWVYGAAVAAEGRAMLVVPGRSPCLRCVFPDPPVAGELPTCDTVGVLATATAVIGSLQANLALLHLAGQVEVPMTLTAVDLAAMWFRSIDLSDGRRADCTACGQRQWEFLDRPAELSLVTLCGQNAVQVRPASSEARINLPEMAKRMAAAGRVQQSAFLVRCDLAEPAGARITLFADARAIIHGTNDFGRAKSIYARLIGN